MKYCLELTDAEVKAMEWCTLSVQEWIEVAVKNRARQAIDEIYYAEIERMSNDSSVEFVPTDKNKVVMAANIKSAATRQHESDLLIAEKVNEYNR